jgi:hypothetical protein
MVKTVFDKISSACSEPASDGFVAPPVVAKQETEKRGHQNMEPHGPFKTQYNNIFKTRFLHCGPKYF